MEEFLHVKVQSSDPYERGLQYGAQAQQLIHQAAEGYRRHFLKLQGLNWDSILGKSELYIGLLERDFSAELTEAKGIADGSHMSLEEILALNCRYEFLKKAAKECTTAAVLPQASQSGSTYLMQNWDYRPWVERHAVVLEIDDTQGTHIVGMTEAGQLLRNGMNNHGIGLCANNLTSTFDTCQVGAPATFVRRKALNCRNFQELCDVVRNSPRGVSCNFMLASAEGKAVDFEATPGGVFEVHPENGIVTHANHMVAGAEFCTNHGSKFRDRVLRKRLMEHQGSLTLEKIQDCLKDHEMLPGWPTVYPESDCREAVCSHIPDGDCDEDRVWKTISSSIYDLQGGVAYICKGCPCEGTYIAYKL